MDVRVGGAVVETPPTSPVQYTVTRPLPPAATISGRYFASCRADTSAASHSRHSRRTSAPVECGPPDPGPLLCPSDEPVVAVLGERPALVEAPLAELGVPEPVGPDG